MSRAGMKSMIVLRVEKRTMQREPMLKGESMTAENSDDK